MGNMKKNKRNGRDKKSQKSDNSKETSNQQASAVNAEKPPPKLPQQEEKANGVTMPPKKIEVKAVEKPVVESKTSTETSATHEQKAKPQEKKELEQKEKQQEAKAQEPNPVEEKKEHQEKPKGFGPSRRRNDRRPRKNSNSTDSSAATGKASDPPRTRVPSEAFTGPTPSRPSEFRNDKDVLPAPATTMATPRDSAPRRDSFTSGRGGGNGPRCSASRFRGNERNDDRRGNMDDWRGNGGRGGRNGDRARHHEGTHHGGGPRNGQGHQGPWPPEGSGPDPVFFVKKNTRDYRPPSDRNNRPPTPNDSSSQQKQPNFRFGAQDVRLLHKQQPEGKPTTAPPCSPPSTTDHSQQICQDVRLDRHPQHPADGIVARVSNLLVNQDLRQSCPTGRHTVPPPPMQYRGGNPHDCRGPPMPDRKNVYLSVSGEWIEDRKVTADARYNNLPVLPIPVLSSMDIRNIKPFVPRAAMSHTSQISYASDFPPLTPQSKMDISQQSGAEAPNLTASDVSVSGTSLSQEEIVTPIIIKNELESIATLNDRPQQKGQSAADKDTNWRIPVSAVPNLSVKELLSPNVPKPRKDIMVFTGTVSNLELPPQSIQVKVAVKPVSNVNFRKDHVKYQLKEIPDVLNPKRGTIDVTSMIENIIKGLADLTPEEVEELLSEYNNTILDNSLLWMNRSFYMKCVHAGFVGHDFKDENIPPLSEYQTNWNEELDLQIKWLDRFVTAKIIKQEQSQEVICKLTEMKELAMLVDEEKVEELAKRNVTYSLADPILRLRFDKPVTEEEMHAIVHRSVTDDCGSYLWIADHAPHKLLGSARIVESIILGISMKRISKDQRPSGAFVKVVPEILRSLTEEERIELAEKYVDAVDTKVDNWPDMLYQGYQMNLTPAQGRRVLSKDIVAVKLLECETKEDLRIFLLACALIADFGFGRVAPVYDFSTDPLCTRIARVLMASNISPEKKATLIEVLLSLPPAIKSRLLAENGFPEDTSLYFTVKAMVTTSFNLHHTEFKKAAGHVIQELTKTLSPARIITYVVLPLLNDSANRMRANAILPDLLQCDTLKKDLLEGTHLTPAVLVNAALAQYEEPKGGPRGGRYDFIKNILGCVDAVLTEEDVAKEMLDEVEAVFKKYLSWYQQLVIIDVGFKKSGHKFALPEFPVVEDSLKSIGELNLTAILGAWHDRAPVHEAFEKAIPVVIPHADPVKLAFVWLTAASAPDSPITEYAPFLKTCLLKMVDKVEDKNENAVPVEKEGGEDAASTEEKEEEASWLTEELLKEGISRELCAFVLDLATKFPVYAKEAEELGKLLKPEVTEEEVPPVAVNTTNDTVEAAVDPITENRSPNDTVAETPAATDGETTAAVQPHPESLIKYLDKKGERYPKYLPALDHDGNARYVIWINEANAHQKDGFRCLLTEKLKDAHIGSVSYRVGGSFRFPWARNPPKYLPDLPMFVEIIAHTKNTRKEAEQQDLLDRAIDSVTKILAELEKLPNSVLEFDLPGVKDEDYNEKVGNRETFRKLRDSLQCTIWTLNRRPLGARADWQRTEPIRVRAARATNFEVLQKAEEHIKSIFGL